MRRRKHQGAEGKQMPPSSTHVHASVRRCLCARRDDRCRLMEIRWMTAGQRSARTTGTARCAWRAHAWCVLLAPSPPFALALVVDGLRRRRSASL